MDFLVVENDGPRIVATNYWDLPHAALGKVLVTVNAGAFRVLMPPSLELAIEDMRTAKTCLVTRGPWPVGHRSGGPGTANNVEILFDDGSDTPYILFLVAAAFDRLPPDSEVGKPCVLSVWTRPRRGVPHMALERPCGYVRF